MTIPQEKLAFVRRLTWAEVFEIWQGNEALRPNWIAHFQSRGFTTWDAWRMTYAVPLGLPEREWALYEVPSPLVNVPQFRGGPFAGWVNRFYDGREAPTFAELVQHPSIQQHGGVLDIIARFPAETIVTGVALPSGVRIVEGMHRSCALALAAARGVFITTRLYIALGSGDEEQLPVVGQG